MDYCGAKMEQAARGKVCQGRLILILHHWLIGTAKEMGIVCHLSQLGVTQVQYCTHCTEVQKKSEKTSLNQITSSKCCTTSNQVIPAKIFPSRNYPEFVVPTA